MRLAICSTVLICGFVLPGQARPNAPAAPHVQQVPGYCKSANSVYAKIIEFDIPTPR